jgi:hypothetical protein
MEFAVCGNAVVGSSQLKLPSIRDSHSGAGGGAAGAPVNQLQRKGSSRIAASPQLGIPDSLEVAVLASTKDRVPEEDRFSAVSIDQQIPDGGFTSEVRPARGSAKSSRAPTGMKRAKVWTIEVENAFRFQLAGFRDMQVRFAQSQFQLVTPVSQHFALVRKPGLTVYSSFFPN